MSQLLEKVIMYVGSKFPIFHSVSLAHQSRITGASQGIGRAIAIECAQHGALLVIHHIGDSKSQQDVEAILAEISAMRNARESAPSAVHIGLDVTLPDAGKR